MRKAAAFLSVVVFSAALGTNVSAAGLDAIDEQATKEVVGNFNATEEVPTVYEVTVNWGNMQFDYNVDTLKTWNTKTHSYETKATSEGKWEVHSKDANLIKVTNHSNAGITASLEYEGTLDDNDTIQGSFTDSENNPCETISLPSAVGTTFDNAPSDVAYLNLSGEWNRTENITETIGNVKVTLKDFEP